MQHTKQEKLDKTQLLSFLAWFTSLSAMLGSLFFSEVMQLKPCILCWYQRIVMYPLVWIIAVCIIKKDKNMPLFVLPMSILGSAIALFHYLLQMKVIPDEVAPCQQGISCTDLLINYFGFITIPFLALTAFLIITVCMIIIAKLQKKNN